MKESEVQKAILDYLKTIRAYVVRLNSGITFSSYVNKEGEEKGRAIRMGEQGTPDIMCAYNGKFYLFEVKRGIKEAEKWKKVVGGFIKLPLIGQKRSEDARAVNQYKQMLRAAKHGFQCYLVQSVADVEAIINDKDPEFYLKVIA